MSLSKKSEGDSCGPLLGGFISSLQELSLTLPREMEREQVQREREKVLERVQEECVLVREDAGGVGLREIIRIQQNEKKKMLLAI